MLVGQEKSKHDRIKSKLGKTYDSRLQTLQRKVTNVDPNGTSVFPKLEIFSYVPEKVNWNNYKKLHRSVQKRHISPSSLLRTEKRSLVEKITKSYKTTSYRTPAKEIGKENNSLILTDRVLNKSLINHRSKSVQKLRKVISVVALKDEDKYENINTKTKTDINLKKNGSKNQLNMNMLQGEASLKYLNLEEMLEDQKRRKARVNIPYPLDCAKLSENVRFLQKQLQNKKLVLPPRWIRNINISKNSKIAM